MGTEKKTERGENDGLAGVTQTYTIDWGSGGQQLCRVWENKVEIIKIQQSDMQNNSINHRQCLRFVLFASVHLVAAADAYFPFGGDACVSFLSPVWASGGIGYRLPNDLTH